MRKLLLFGIITVATIICSADECISPNLYSEAVNRAEDLAVQLGRLRNTLAAEKSALEVDLKQKLESAEQQTKTCHDGTDALFKRVEKCETDKQALTSSASRHESAMQECQKRVSALNEQSAEALASCHREVTELRNTEAVLLSCQSDFKLLKEEASSIKASSDSKEKTLLQQLSNLKSKLESTEVERKNVIVKNEEINRSIKQLNKDLEYARTLVNESNDSKLLFSFRQMRTNAQKIMIINKAVAELVWDKLYGSIPPSTFENIKKIEEEILAQTKLVYAKTTPYISMAEGILTTNFMRAQNLFEIYATPYIQDFLQRTPIKRKLEQTMNNLAEESISELKTFNGWVNNNLFIPLINRRSELKELIPESPIDQLMAMLYLIIVLYIVMLIVKAFFYYGLRPVTKLIRYLLFLPFSLTLRCLRLLCGKNKKRQNKKKMVSPDYDSSVNGESRMFNTDRKREIKKLAERKKGSLNDKKSNNKL